MKSEIEAKEHMAKRELARVQELIEQRQTQKSIRQEAFEIGRMRRQKSEQYRHELIKSKADEKQKRSEAIHNGYMALRRMRTAMKDIMIKATNEIKEEMHQLQHKDQFSPEKVIDRALGVSERVLFPKLGSTFGFQNSHDNSAANRSHSRPQTAPLSATKCQSLDASHTSFFDTHDLNNTAPTIEVTPFSPTDRAVPSTLPLKVFDKEAFANTLVESKIKAEKVAILESKSKPKLAPDNLNTSSVASSERPPQPKRPHTGSAIKSTKTPGINEKEISAVDIDAEDSLDSIPDFDMEDGKVFYSFSYEKSMEEIGNSSKDLKKNSQSEISKGKDTRRVVSAKARFVPLKPGEFRKEMSADHPLAGGKGEYKKEKSVGLREASGANLLGHQPKTPSHSFISPPVTEDISDEAFRKLEALKKSQNEYMLQVLAEERAAEENREKTLSTFKRSNMSAEEELSERRRMEAIFAEQRVRASERIIRLTKEHEHNIQMALMNARM